jgi:hypothetical protein
MLQPNPGHLLEELVVKESVGVRVAETLMEKQEQKPTTQPFSKSH